MCILPDFGARYSILPAVAALIGALTLGLAVACGDINEPLLEPGVAQHSTMPRQCSRDPIPPGWVERCEEWLAPPKEEPVPIDSLTVHISAPVNGDGAYELVVGESRTVAAIGWFEDVPYLCAGDAWREVSLSMEDVCVLRSGRVLEQACTVTLESSDPEVATIEPGEVAECQTSSAHQT